MSEEVKEEEAEFDSNGRCVPPPYPGKPPFELVPLSNFSKETWKGRAVFHPMVQIGSNAFWNAEDDPYFIPEDEMFEGVLIPGDEPGTSYDVGIVAEFKTTDWRGDKDEELEVYFLTGDGYMLHYGAYNLWTPKELG